MTNGYANVRPLAGEQKVGQQLTVMLKYILKDNSGQGLR